MTKLQYIVRPRDAMDAGVFSASVMDGLIPKIRDRGPERLKITLTGRTAPRLSVIPFRKTPLALISIWPADGADPGQWTALEPADGLMLAGYQVRESTPVAYHRGWPTGETTPGAGLLTLLRQRRGLSREEFIRRWYDGHSPLSLKIHPLWNYIRNEVQERLVPGSPDYDGIVEEQFRTAADLLNPLRFFGGPLWMLPNMARVAMDIAGFLDLWSLESYLVDEIHLI